MSPKNQPGKPVVQTQMFHTQREGTESGQGRQGLLTTQCPVLIRMTVWISVREEWAVIVTWINIARLKRSDLLYIRVRKARRNSR